MDSPGIELGSFIHCKYEIKCGNILVVFYKTTYQRTVSSLDIFSILKDDVGAFTIKLFYLAITTRSQASTQA